MGIFGVNFTWFSSLNNVVNNLTFQIGLVLVGLSSVLRDNHQGATKGHVILGTTWKFCRVHKCSELP